MLQNSPNGVLEYHPPRTNNPVALLLKHPLYIGFDTFDIFPRKRTALLLDAADFGELQRTIRPGAFGSDYMDWQFIQHVPGTGDREEELKHIYNWKLVWKIPFELNWIRGFGTIGLPIEVGTYSISLPMQPGMTLLATKIRFDIPTDTHVDAVHHLELGRLPRLKPCIALEFFVKDPDDVTRREDANLRRLVEHLHRKAGLLAFISQEHRAIVFHTDMRGEKEEMRPHHMADLLVGSRGKTIRLILADAYAPEDRCAALERWIKNYKQVYGMSA